MTVHVENRSVGVMLSVAARADEHEDEVVMVWPLSLSPISALMRTHPHSTLPPHEPAGILFYLKVRWILLLVLVQTLNPSESTVIRP